MGMTALTLSADGKTAATVQVRTTRSLSLLPGALEREYTRQTVSAGPGCSVRRLDGSMASCSFPTDKACDR